MSTTAVAAVPVRTAAARSGPPGWWRFLRREFAPTPDRDTRTLQIVASVVIVQLVSMTLRVPEASLSCYLALFLVRENRSSSLLASVVISVAFSVAVAATIFCFHWTFDYPEWRIPVLALATFVGMWLSRACTVGPIGFAVGFVLAVTQSTADGVPTTGIALRSVLSTLVAVCYPAFVVYAVSTYLLPISARNSVVAGINERLELALAALRTATRGEMPDRNQGRDHLDRATHGSAQLLKTLGAAEKERPRWKAHHADLTAAITASEQVAVSAAALQLAARPVLSDADRSRAGRLTAEILHLGKALRQRRRPASPPTEPETPAESARLREIQLAVADLRDSLAGSPLADLPAPPEKKKGFFKPDAFTNPEYVHFALKVTLAAMICYFFYTGVDWSGIRTAFITCCIIALETSGGSMHKGTLRIVGCLGGGLLGFVCLLYAIPHMTEITALLLLSALGASIGGWIATGSERIGYAGVQFNYAFFICIDQNYGPDVNLTSIRDRIIGILLGLTVSSIVYRYIWPDRATDKLRVVFARALRNIRRLLQLSPADAKARPPRELYESVVTDLAETQQLLDFARFEDQDDRTTAALASAQPQAMVRHAQALCLVAGQLLGRSQADEWRALAAREQTEDEGARNAAADALDRVTHFVGHGGRAPGTGPAANHPLTREAGDRAQLRGRLLEECALLTESCRAVDRSRPA